MAKWIQDLSAETRISDFGGKFKVEKVLLSQIDWQSSKTNGARLNDALNEDLVLEYALAMERGDAFPMIVLLAVGKTFLILSGNHRAAAAKQIDDSEAMAYVIHSDDKALIDLLPRVLNRLHGKRQSRDEAMAHAVHAVEHFGYEPRKAAEIFGLARDSVGRELTRQKTKGFLETKGVRVGTLNNLQIDKLSSIKNENVLSAAARLASETGMIGETVEQLSKEVREQRTEASQMAVIADWEKKTAGMQPSTAPKFPKPLRSKFTGCLTTLEKYLKPVSKLTQLQITDKSETENVKARLRNLVEKIEIILAGGRKSKS